MKHFRLIHLPQKELAFYHFMLKRDIRTSNDSQMAERFQNQKNIL